MQVVILREWNGYPWVELVNRHSCVRAWARRYGARFIATCDTSLWISTSSLGRNSWSAVNSRRGVDENWWEVEKRKWACVRLDWCFLIPDVRQAWFSSSRSSRSSSCTGVAVHNESRRNLVNDWKQQQLSLGMLAIEITTTWGYETGLDNPEDTTWRKPDHGLPSRKVITF